MTTYTLTRAQYDELSIATGHVEVWKVLGSLKPNSQEPVGIVSTTPYNGTLASWYPYCGVKHNDLLYTHPAPLSKEDMVKVLDTLRLPCDRWNKVQTLKINEAITIMHSAIECKH